MYVSEKISLSFTKRRAKLNAIALVEYTYVF